MPNDNKRPRYMAERLIIAERLDCASSTAYLWLRDDSPEYQRRCEAALTATRTDFTQPDGGLSEWLNMNHGVTVTDVAEWYGYSASSFYSWVGAGRSTERCTHRGWTLVDYYLKVQAQDREDVK